MRKYSQRKLFLPNILSWKRTFSSPHDLKDFESSSLLVFFHTLLSLELNVVPFVLLLKIGKVETWERARIMIKAPTATHNS